MSGATDPTYWARQLEMIRAQRRGEDVSSPDSEHYQAWLEVETWEEVLAMAGPYGAPMEPRRAPPAGATCRKCGANTSRHGGEIRCFGTVCFACLRGVEDRVARCNEDARSQVARGSGKRMGAA